MSEITVFYAWQSDSPNRTNLNFIQTAIEKAAKRIDKDAGIELSPRLDRDTRGMSGMPAIADTILEKIDASGMIVADLTLVGFTDPQLTMGQFLGA